MTFSTLRCWVFVEQDLPVLSALCVDIIGRYRQHRSLTYCSIRGYTVVYDLFGRRWRFDRTCLGADAQSGSTSLEPSLLGFLFLVNGAETVESKCSNSVSLAHKYPESVQFGAFHLGNYP